MMTNSTLIGLSTYYGSVECYEINKYVNILFHFHVCKMQSHEIYKGPSRNRTTNRLMPTMSRKIFDPMLVAIQIVINFCMNAIFICLCCS